MNELLTFGLWLKQRRRILSLTQEELARRVLCSAITVRKIESGDLLPSQELAQAMAELLGVPASQYNAFLAFARSESITAPASAFVSESVAAETLTTISIPTPSAPPALSLPQLRQRFAILTGGPRNLSPRQQTMHNAIAWSYNLLPPAEQHLFNLPGVFVGGCTPEAVAAVTGKRSNRSVHSLAESESATIGNQESVLKR